jgi:hypothetical protein
MPDIGKARTGDRQFRVEWSSQGRTWHPYDQSNYFARRGLDNYRGTFDRLEDALTAARRRSEERKGRQFRVVDLHTGSVSAIFPTPVSEGERMGVVPGKGPYMWRAEFYRSTASGRISGSGTGRYAPDDGSGYWYPGPPKGNRHEAKRIYESWALSRRAGFKRARVVEVHDDGTEFVIIDSLYEGGIMPHGATPLTEGATTVMMDGAQVEEPLTIPRTRLISKIEASIEKDRAKFTEDQQKLLDEAKARLDKIEKIASDPWLVLKLVEYVISDVSHFHDPDETYEAVARHYGKQPGTAEFSAEPSAVGILSALKAATDPNIMVKPRTDLFRFLAVDDGDDTTTGDVEPPTTSS